MKNLFFKFRVRPFPAVFPSRPYRRSTPTGLEGLVAFTGGSTAGKFRARETVVNAFYQRTGLHRIPRDRSCIVLSGEQSKDQKSQLNQYLGSGLLAIQQFVGVDRDPAIIAQNQRNHPGAQFVAGEWSTQFPRLLYRDPMLIDLDTTSMGMTRQATGWLQQTLLLSPCDSLVAFTFILKNPYGSQTCSANDVLEAVRVGVPFRVRRAWGACFSTFCYKSQETPMRTIIFHRPAEVRRRVA